MEEAEHNSRIEKIAEMILSDNISLDEQEQNKLKKILYKNKTPIYQKI